MGLEHVTDPRCQNRHRHTQRERPPAVAFVNDPRGWRGWWQLRCAECVDVLDHVGGEPYRVVYLNHPAPGPDQHRPADQHHYQGHPADCPGDHHYDD